MAWRVMRLAALIAVPIAVTALPTSTLAAMPNLCLFKAIFNHECWGCGMTRAVSSVVHGHWTQALAYNRLIVIVFPWMSVLWAWWIWREGRGCLQVLRRSR